MTLNAGTKLGTYEILGSLGAGGMGEVYRARDSKLKRDVAIKILPEEFSRDTERLLRFQREAEVVAQLNHPHVAAIYDLGESGDRRFLVLELVEGETLAERLRRGPLPVEESLAIAKQIAEALESAHAKGVTHRDLKPGNIKLTPDETAKVLDFGLAKISGAIGSSDTAALSNSPTLMTASMPGVIFGTAAYMSPEQALGKSVESTTDIWAFGCVLFEMLTGKRVFEGESVGEILAAVLKQEPEWNALPRDVPQGVRRLLRRCLAKDRRRRLQSISDARIEIEEAKAEELNVQQTGVSRRKERIGWSIVLLAVVATAGILLSLRPLPSMPEMTVEVSVPSTTDPGSMAISPDGLKITFVGTSGGRPQLMVRSLDSPSIRTLAGTDYAELPFWSSDSRSIAFFAEDKLKRISIDGGSAEGIVETFDHSGGGGALEDTVYFVPRNREIQRVSSKGGGTPVAATRLLDGQTSHGLPIPLLDRRHLLYFVTGDPNSRGVYIDRLDGSLSRRVLGAEMDGGAVYHPSGRLLFVRQGSLFSQKLDLSKLELQGEESLVADQVTVMGRRTALSVSASGTIAYRSGTGGQRQFIWFDRSGKQLETVGMLDNLNVRSAALSRDGRYIAMSRTVRGNFDIWMLDVLRGGLSPVTTAPSAEIEPFWSPDGRHLVFRSTRSGASDLYVKDINGPPGSERPLASTPLPEVPSDWSGKFVLFDSVNDPKTGRDIWALPVDADGKPGEKFAVVQSGHDEFEGKLSPDGKWIAYESNESGGAEVYIQGFRNAGKRTQVSLAGGGQIQWRRDSQELFFLAHDGKLMAASIRVTSGGDIDAGVPAALFQTRMVGAGHSRQYERVQYSVSEDGQRFLMNTATEVPPLRFTSS